MNKDKDLEELFKSYSPNTDKEKFISSLEGKIAVIDSVRSEVDHIERFHRMIAAVCLVIGFTVGSALMSIVMLHPINWESLHNTASIVRISPVTAAFLARYADMILSLVASAFFIIGILPIARVSGHRNYTA